MTINEYIALIPSINQDKPKFISMISADVAPYSQMQAILEGLTVSFDVDFAIGAQLDIIGEWVGFPRSISIPLTNVYFAWDSTVTVGWDSGTWIGAFDPTTGLSSLPDDSYRKFIKAKIAANSWDGSIPGAYTVWESIFTNSYIIIQDHQDMSMTIGIAGEKLGAVDQAMLTGGYLPIKPMGVRVDYYAIAQSTGPLLAWDIMNTALAGWDSGQWPLQI